jgi:RimJ/RimL family protein N-acetyltransferase
MDDVNRSFDGDAVTVDTARLSLRRLSRADAPFMLELLNDADFVRYIGDKGARTPDDAARYIEDGAVASYRRHGFGLYRVDRREGGRPIGICGLIKRDALEDVDVGFAFLPGHRGRGYALESVRAVLDHARDDFGLTRLVAIVAPDNRRSIRLLERTGFRFDRAIVWPPHDEILHLMAVDVGPFPLRRASDRGA